MRVSSFFVCASPGRPQRRGIARFPLRNTVPDSPNSASAPLLCSQQTPTASPVLLWSLPSQGLRVHAQSDAVRQAVVRVVSCCVPKQMARTFQLVPPLPLIPLRCLTLNGLSYLIKNFAQSGTCSPAPSAHSLLTSQPALVRLGVPASYYGTYMVRLPGPYNAREGVPRSGLLRTISAEAQRSLVVNPFHPSVPLLLSERVFPVSGNEASFWAVGSQ